MSRPDEWESTAGAVEALRADLDAQPWSRHDEIFLVELGIDPSGGAR
jgi:hypothetical protein